MTENERLQAALEFAVAALRYYARASNYSGRTANGAPKPVNVLSDRGERARDALDNIEGPKP